jgi:hypothetical protein
LAKDRDYTNNPARQAGWHVVVGANACLRQLTVICWPRKGCVRQLKEPYKLF